VRLEFAMKFAFKKSRSQSRRTFLKNLGRIALFTGLALLAYKLLGRSIFEKTKEASCRQNFICSRCTLLASCPLPPALSRKRSVN
jgi:hypothetical protein